MQTYTARRLLTPIGSVEYPLISIGDDGLIEDIESDPTLPHANDTLTAAFLDIHTHGGLSHDVMTASQRDFAEFNHFLATRGVGQYLATTVTAPIDATLRGLASIADEIERAHQGEATPVGIHLEGPFISHAKRGVHPEGDILPPSIDLFDRFQQAARGHIKLMTMAPEIAGAVELIAHATAQGVRISLGHTNATSPETQAGIDAGATSATHTYNAMRALDHRAPGVLGTVLDSSKLFAELICDGIHVAPELVRLWLKAKGPELAMLVTDSMSAAGMPDGAYTLGTFEVAVAHGKALLKSDLDRGKETLAGSILTMDQAVANVRAMTGITLREAVNLASANPARMLGLDPAIRPGAVANFNRFDANGVLIGTILKGMPIH